MSAAASSAAVRRYRAFALLFLGATVTSGAWLRASLVDGDLLAGFHFGDAVHAHSHLAFFGWIGLALFGLLAADLLSAPGSAGAAGNARASVLEGRLGLHGAAVALASAGAFVSFLHGGYTPASMALAGLHVLLWIGFAALAWRALSLVQDPARAFYRASLVCLLAAGAGTMAPAFVMIRGVRGAWWNELSIGLFLVPFLAGFTALGVMGAVYRRLPDAVPFPGAHGAPGTRSSRTPRAVLLLTGAGLLPSVLSYPGTPAPWAGADLLGRLGLGLVGAGLLLFGVDVLRRSRGTVRPRELGFLGLAAAAAALAGALEVALSLGVGEAIAHRRPVTIAFLHLVLLGFVSPGLLYALGVTGRRAPRRVLLYAGGLAAMLATLVVTGVGPLLDGAARLGLGYDDLMLAALAGGGAVAVAVLTLLPGALGSGGASRFREGSPAPRRAGAVGGSPVPGAHPDPAAPSTA